MCDHAMLRIKITTLQEGSIDFKRFSENELCQYTTIHSFTPFISI